MKTMEDVLLALSSAKRLGTEKDEPEGSRYIIISDTLAQQMENALSLHVFSHEIGIDAE